MAQELREALLDVQAEAKARVGTPDELGQIFFPALRDYVEEIANPPYPGTSRNTNRVSALSRWGIDFKRRRTARYE